VAQSDVTCWAEVADDWITWDRTEDHDAFWAYRTALAVPEIRMRLAARLGNLIRGSHRDRKAGRVLQPQTLSQRPWRQTARLGLRVRQRRDASRSAGAEISLSYIKKSAEGLAHSSLANTVIWKKSTAHML
jgi:hypothetical protein